MAMQGILAFVYSGSASINCFVLTSSKSGVVMMLHSQEKAAPSPACKGQECK
jgi:hypothetical protein